MRRGLLVAVVITLVSLAVVPIVAGQNYVGTIFGDHIIGTENDDSMDGGLGNDHLEGRGGDDTLSGNLGNDVIEGGNGNDTANGGWDNDNFSGGNGHDVYATSLGSDTANGGAGLDVLRADVGIQALSGGADNDAVVSLTGTSLHTLEGGEGNDIVVGWGVVRGGGGNDVLTSNGGTLIDGGPGNDICRRAALTPTVNCETVVTIGIDLFAPSLTITSAPAENAVLTSGSITASFTSSNAAATYCMVDTGAISACSGSYTASGLSNGDHALAIVAVSSGAQPAQVFVRHFKVNAPVEPASISSVASPQAEALRFQTQTLTNVASIKAYLADGGNAAWAIGDTRVATASVSGPAIQVTIQDPNLAAERVTMIELRRTNASVITSWTGDQFVASSVQLASAASPAASTLQIAGTYLDRVDSIALIHSSGTLTIQMTDLGVTRTVGLITISSAALDGLVLSQVNAIRAVDGNEVVSTLDVSIAVAQSDVVPPVITVPNLDPVEAVGASGAPVAYSVAAADARDGVVAVACAPESGSTFSIGSTAVNCSAHDAAGNESSESFEVVVRDTTGPALTLPVPAPVEAAADGTAIVTFAATGNDLVDGIRDATCSPTSGSTFVVGTHLVTCSADDTRGNQSTAMFSLTIVDATAPVLQLPTELVAEASGVDGASVTFDATARDAVDGDVVVACEPSTGSLFALGDTKVDCSATDHSGNVAGGAFTVRVADTTPPVITTPDELSISIQEEHENGVVYSASALDAVDGSVDVNCTPPPGAHFPRGETLVTCLASDIRGNASAATFLVDVTGNPPRIEYLQSNDRYISSPSGGPVNYEVRATDDSGSVLETTCQPASGSVQQVGPLTVSCSATDSANQSATLELHLNVHYREPFQNAIDTIATHLPSIWEEQFATNLPMSTVESMPSPTTAVLLVDDGNGGTQRAVAHGAYGFVDADGDVQRIDTSLVSTGAGWRPRGVGYKVTLGNSYADGFAVELDAPGAGVRYRPQGVRPDSPSGAVAQTGDRMLYPAVWDQTDVVQTALADEVSEHLIVKSSDAPTTFRWVVDHPQGTEIAIDEGGALTLDDGSSVRVLTPAPAAFDATGQAIPVGFDLVREGGEDVLVLSYDVSMDQLLLDHPVVWPLDIDPTVIAPALYADPIYSPSFVYAGTDANGLFAECTGAKLDVEFVGNVNSSGAERTINADAAVGCGVTGPDDGASWYSFAADYHWGFGPNQHAEFETEDGVSTLDDSNRNLGYFTSSHGLSGDSKVNWTPPDNVNLALVLYSDTAEKLGTVNKKALTRAVQLNNPSSVFIDTLPPVVAEFSPSSWPDTVSPGSKGFSLIVDQDGAGCGSAIVRFTGVDDPLIAVDYPLADCGGSGAIDLTGVLPGRYRLSFTAYDLVGNVTTSDALGLTKDFTIVDPITQPDPGSVVSSSANIRVNAAADLPTTNAVLSASNTANGTATIAIFPLTGTFASRDIVWDTTALPNGEYELSLSLASGEVLKAQAVIVYNDTLFGQRNGELSSTTIPGGLTGTHANGNVSLAMTDVTIDALDATLEIGRVYNSQLEGSGTFGHAGWRATFDQKLALGANGFVRYSDPSGMEFEYIRNADGSYRPARGTDARLHALVDGSYVLRDRDGSKQRFDNMGRWTGWTSPNENSIHANWTGSRMTSLADDSGLALVLGYDGQDRLETITDPAQYVYRYSYDADGDLTSFTDPAGGVWNYTYNSNNNLETAQEPSTQRAARVVYNHDGEGGQEGTVRSLADAELNVVTFTYDFELASVEAAFSEPGESPANSPTTVYVLDDFGRALETITPGASGSQTTRTYDGLARMTSELQGPRVMAMRMSTASAVDDIHETYLTYDAAGNLLTERTSGTSADHGGDGAEWLTTIYAGYDAFGNAATVTDPKGNVTSTTYDEHGNELTRVAPEGGATINLYGDYETAGVYGRLASTTAPSGSVTQYFYNEHGNQVATVDGRGGQTQTDYDSNQRVTGEFSDADGYTTHVLDRVGRALITTDGDNVVTRATYDGNGNVLTSTNGLGGVTENTYDNNGDLVTSEAPLDRTTTYTYDRMGNQLTKKGPDNKTWKFSYDENGNRTSMTDPLEKSTEYAYDSQGRLTTITEPGDAVTQLFYDAAGNQISRIDADLHTTFTDYYPDGSVMAETNGEGEVTEFAYDGNANLESTSYADGTSSATVYDSSDRRIHETGADGTATSTHFDAQDNMYLVQKGAHTWERTGFDASGRLTADQDLNGLQHLYDYDPKGRLARLRSNDVPDSSFDYDGSGRLYKVTDVDGRATEIVRNSAGDVEEIKNPGGSSIMYGYYPSGQLHTRTENGKITTYKWDDNGRIEEVKPAGELASVFEYDDRGNLDKQTVDGVTTSYTHTPGNVVRTSTIGGATTTYDHDAAGRITAIRAPSGITSYVWEDGRLQSSSNPATGLTTYEYNPQGQVSKKLHASGNTSYEYDELGHVNKVTLPDGEVTTYVNLPNGRPQIVQKDSDRTAFTYQETGLAAEYRTGTSPVSIDYSTGANGIVTGMEVDGVPFSSTIGDDGQIDTQTSPYAGTSGYEYDAAGRLGVVTHANGERTAYTYGSMGNIESVQSESGFAFTSLRLGATSGRRATYDNGEIEELYSGGRATLGVWEAGGSRKGYAMHYSNDRVERLTFFHTTRPSTRSDSVAFRSLVLSCIDPDRCPDPEVAATVRRIEDLSVNTPRDEMSELELDVRFYLQNMERQVNNYDPNTARLDSFVDYTASRTTHLEYDEQGNESRRTIKRLGSVIETVDLDFDMRGSMRSFTSSVPGRSTDLAYDYTGRIVREDAAEGVTSYTYDRFGRLIRARRDGEERWFTYNALGLEAMSRVTFDLDESSATSETYYFEFDFRGNVRRLVGDDGTVAVGYKYDLWGNVIEVTGDASLASSNPFQFAGRSGAMYFPKLKMNYMGVRWYAPDEMRFISPDPAGLDTSRSADLYAYAGNDPVNNVDTDGRRATPVRTIGTPRPQIVPEPIPMLPRVKIDNPIANVGRDPFVPDLGLPESSEKQEVGVSADQQKAFDEINSRNLIISNERFKHVWNTHSFVHRNDKKNVSLRKSYFNSFISGSGRTMRAKQALFACADVYHLGQASNVGKFLVFCGVPTGAGYARVPNSGPGGKPTKLFVMVINQDKKLQTAYPEDIDKEFRNRIMNRVWAPVPTPVTVHNGPTVVAAGLTSLTTVTTCVGACV